MPGIGRKSAERILAETGVEMEHFQNESRFSSWAGLVPECKESAGKKMSTRIRKGNKYLKATLVECARAGIRNKPLPSLTVSVFRLNYTYFLICLVTP